MKNKIENKIANMLIINTYFIFNDSFFENKFNMTDWKTYKVRTAEMQKTNDFDEAIKLNLSKIGYEL